MRRQLGLLAQPSRDRFHGAGVSRSRRAMTWCGGALSFWLAALANPAMAQTSIAAGGDGGVPASPTTAGEIRIGNTTGYTGPLGIFGFTGKTIAAYFDQVNAAGGANGHKIRFISYDDGYDPRRTVELTHKLVEEDNVLLMFGSIGRDRLKSGGGEVRCCGSMDRYAIDWRRNGRGRWCRSERLCCLAFIRRCSSR
jgi:hypothetical protein